ncbi:MAG: flagellar hook-basal body complex protein FliE [Phycisphaeraceae bacterium]|nr:flagellar hook-basal body complex protein FliE [Phycisphaeraceae bacterium]
MTDPLGLIGNTFPVQTPQAPKPPGLDGAAPQASFADALKQQIEHVNRLQQDAETAIGDLVAGRRDDVDGVLIAKQKADMAFRMLLQVRNKLVGAYDEIKQMRV